MDSAQNDQIFDLSYLNQVFQGNEAMINSIISLFLQQVPQYINEMESCVKEGDYDNLHPLAHKAKSSIAMLGLKEMEIDILQIEYNSKQIVETEALPELVERVRKKCDVAFEQLTIQLSQGKMPS